MYDRRIVPLRGSRMNPRRVIFWMTVAIFFVLTFISVLFFHGIPPWPVLACFAVSHGTFCLIIRRVKPYHGPYTAPMDEPGPEKWPQP